MNLIGLEGVLNGCYTSINPLIRIFRTNFLGDFQDIQYNREFSVICIEDRVGILRNEIYFVDFIAVNAGDSFTNLI